VGTERRGVVVWNKQSGEGAEGCFVDSTAAAAAAGGGGGKFRGAVTLQFISYSTLITT
jgi:hypothetical protein